MKKSQLRNIIRGIIREQLDVDKNKLRPIDAYIEPPTGQTPNSHEMIMGYVCANGQYWTGNYFTPTGFGSTPTIQGYGGFQCNGQMCDQGDLGQPFIMPSYDIYINGVLVPIQLVFTLIDFKNPVYETNLRDMIDSNCNHVFGCTDPAANNYDITATMDDGSCTYTSGGCDPNNAAVQTFNSWPTSITSPSQGETEFNTIYAAQIQAGISVDSQWYIPMIGLAGSFQMGGVDTYYPVQSVYCEYCQNLDGGPTGIHPIWAYVGNPSGAPTSPVNSPYWLIDPYACCGCPGYPWGYPI